MNLSKVEKIPFSKGPESAHPPTELGIGWQIVNIDSGCKKLCKLFSQCNAVNYWIDEFSIPCLYERRFHAKIREFSTVHIRACKATERSERRDYGDPEAAYKWGR